MTLFHSHYRVVYVRVTVRVIWYKGSVTTEVQNLGLKDGQMDGRTDIDAYSTRLSSQNFWSS